MRETADRLKKLTLLGVFAFVLGFAGTGYSDDSLVLKTGEDLVTLTVENMT